MTQFVKTEYMRRLQADRDITQDLITDFILRFRPKSDQLPDPELEARSVQQFLRDHQVLVAAYVLGVQLAAIDNSLGYLTAEFVEKKMA